MYEIKNVRKLLIINEILVEAAGVELITMLTARKLLIPGTATTAKKAPLPDPLYVYCTKMLFALESCRPPHSDHSIPLRLIPAGAQHEVTSPASNLARAPARTLVLCLVFLGRHYWCALPTLRRAAPRPFSLPSPMETEVHRQQPQPRTRSEPAHPYTNPIVPQGRLPSSRCI